jgi:hypothetical protein
VSEPSSDHVYLDTGLEQMSCSGVPKEVRTDASWLGTCGIPCGGVAANDLIDPEPRQRSAMPGAKYRISGCELTFGEQLHEMLDSLVPEWTEAPLISLTVQTNFAGCFETQVFDAKIHDFLRASTSIVEKQHQGPVT